MYDPVDITEALRTVKESPTTMTEKFEILERDLALMKTAQVTLSQSNKLFTAHLDSLVAESTPGSTTWRTFYRLFDLRHISILQTPKKLVLQDTT